jgi:shikimate kinase
MIGPIFLIGYRGTGKTSVARELAALLGVKWVDADAVLEVRAGKTIRQIFADDGEPAFRDLESSVLRDLATFGGVVATGGGVVLRPENREILKQGLVVWLTAPAEVIWRRMQADVSTADRRPNLAQGGLDEVKSLLAIREPLYRECASAIVDSTNDGVLAIAERIRKVQSTPQVPRAEKSSGGT